MSPFVASILPLFFSFAVGVAARQLKLLSAKDATVLLRFVPNVCLPPLMILAIYRVELAGDMVLIPFCAMLVVFAIYFISSAAGKALRMSGPTFGSFLVGTLIMNTAFALPFFQSAFGDEGLARASLYDIGNTFLIFTFSYYNAIKYGDNSHTDKIQWNKFLKLPPLWAMLVAFGIKLGGMRIPPLGIEILEMLGQPSGTIIMVAMGLTFHPRLSHLGKACLGVFIRMGCGLGIGLLLAWIFGLQGIARNVVVTCSAMPVGFNTLIFAELENLDLEFASTMVSISIVLAMITTPLLIQLFS